MCSSGNIPAQATAKSVMASANRLIDVRHCCRNNSKIAEISVPACPIPIHHTKLTIANPADRDIDAPDSHALDEQIPNGKIQQHQQREGQRKAENPALG